MQNNLKKYFTNSRFQIIVTFSLCTLCGCSLTDPLVGTNQTVITEPWSSNENQEAGKRIENSLDEVKSVNATGSPGYPKGEMDSMGLWSDPTFQRQFMGSYGIRTEIEPEVTEIERETLSQVMHLMSEENMNQARDLLEETITPDTSAHFDFILGNIYFQDDDLPNASRCYTRAVSKFPDFLRVHKNLAMVEVRNAKFDAAIQSLTRAIELGEGNALSYGLLGYAYTSIENQVNAESAYRRAMMLQPDSADWKLGLAQALFKQEKYADAASLCSQLISQNPENIDYWRLQSNAYLGLDQPLKAAQNYEYLRTIGAADVASLSKLGDIYVKEKMLDMAAEAYAEALENDSVQSASPFIRNAKILANYAGLDEAEQLVQKIKEIFSSSLSNEQKVELLNLEARIALNKGADEKQAELLEKIVQIDPMDGEALILLGQYFARKDNPEKAVFYYERAEAIEAVEAKAKIRHAQLLVQESKYQEAVPLLENALRIEHRSEVEEYLTQVKAAAKSRQ